MRNWVPANTNPFWDAVLPGSGTTFPSSLAAPSTTIEGPTSATRANYTSLTGATEWRAATITAGATQFDMVSSYFASNGPELRCFAAGTCTTVDQTCRSSATDGQVITNTLGGPIGAGGTGYVCDVGWTGFSFCVDWSSVRAGDDSNGPTASYTAHFVR